MASIERTNRPWRGTLWFVVALLCLAHALVVLADISVEALGYSLRNWTAWGIVDVRSMLLIPESYMLFDLCQWGRGSMGAILLGTVLADLILGVGALCVWRGRDGDRAFAVGVALRAVFLGARLFALAYVLFIQQDDSVSGYLNEFVEEASDALVSELLLSIPAIAILLLPSGVMGVLRTGWRWKLRVLAVTGAVAVLVGVSVTSGINQYHRRLEQAPAEVERQLQALRDAGAPTTFIELEQFCRLPKGVVDATDIWFEGRVLDDVCGFHSMSTYRVTSALWRPPGYWGGDWPYRELARERMGEHAAVLAHLHDAACQNGKVQIDADWTFGVEVAIPAPKLIHCCVAGLGWEANERAYAGDSAGVAQSIWAMLRAAEALEYDPWFLSQRERRDCTICSVRTLTDVLPQVELSDDDKNMLAEQLAGAAYRKAMVRSLIGERAALIGLMRDPVLADSRLVGRDVDLALMLRIMAENERVLAKPWLEGRDDVRRLRKEVTSLRQTIQGKQLYSVAPRILPNYEAVSLIAAQSLLFSRLGRVAIALDSYFRKNGKLPKTLDELAPQFIESVPLDPMDGRPLKYDRPSDAVCSVYSIGLGEGPASRVENLEPWSIGLFYDR